MLDGALNSCSPVEAAASTYFWRRTKRATIVLCWLLGKDEKLKDLVSQFLDHWRNAFSKRGLDMDEELVHETQFLRGQPRKLIGATKEFVVQIVQCATEGLGVEEMHRQVRSTLKQKGKGYIRPEEEFARLLAAEPPYFPTDFRTDEAPNVIPFPRAD